MGGGGDADVIFAHKINKMQLVLPTKSKLCQMNHLSFKDLLRLCVTESSIALGQSPLICCKATLSSPMREGQTQKILVSDVSEEALRHLLVLIYTGCPDKDLDLVTSGCCFQDGFKSEAILLRNLFF